MAKPLYSPIRRRSLDGEHLEEGYEPQVQEKRTSAYTRRRGILVLAGLALLAFLWIGSIPDNRTAAKQAVQSFFPVPSGSNHKDLAAGLYRQKSSSKIIKLTFAYGKGSIDATGHGADKAAIREGVIQGHIEHARKFGYKQYVQREDIFEDILTKPATALQIILEELQKPKDKRAEWLVQHDADMVVFNDNIPLETFLPPKDREDIHLIATEDGHGFNTGCVYMRISPLVAKLLGGNIMYQDMPGKRPHFFAEQGMLGNLVADVPTYNLSTAIVPKHWINAYPPNWEGGFSPGDWILHTVAWAKADLGKYLEESKLRKPENLVSPEELGLTEQVRRFWEIQKKDSDRLQKYWKETVENQKIKDAKDTAALIPADLKEGYTGNPDWSKSRVTFDG